MKQILTHIQFPLIPLTLKISLVFSLSTILIAQNVGHLSGTVIDEKTGEPLVGVNVLIQNTFIGTATDNQGHFEIPNLKFGDYNVIASMIGYRKELIKNISIQSGTDHFLDIRLKRDVLASPAVIVTASRREQDIMESPLSVAVVGIRQIEEKAAISLVEILPYEAGVNTVKGQLNIRGASGYTMGAGERSLLLLDGVPLLGSAAGNITWSVIPTSEIAQVEIVKSGGSALYGSSALGGVLNIITRNAPTTPETRIRVKMGGYSQPKYIQWQWRDKPGLFYTTELTHARPFGPHNFWIRAQRRYSDGYTQLTWMELNNITGKAKLNFGKHFSTSLYVNYYTDRSGLESQWKSPADPFEAPIGEEDNYGKGSKLHINGFFNYISSPNVVIKIKGALYDVHWQNYGTNQDFSNEKKYFGEVQFATNWSKSLNTTAGIVLQRTSIDARIFGDHHSLSTAAYLLTQQRMFQEVTVSAGGRWETYQVDDKTLDQSLAPQVALNWKHNDWLAVRGSIGWGFRVPTVAELFTRSKLNVFIVESNPDLKAETSISLETGCTVMLPGKEWLPNLKLDVGLFQNEFKNLIEPSLKPDVPDTIQFQNIKDARITGAEVGLKSALLKNKLLLGIAYTWLDPLEVNTSGTVIDTLSYRFRHTLVSTITGYWLRFSVTLEHRYSSRMDKVELFDENPLTEQDKRVPIRLWNASVSYSWHHWEFLLRCENLFQYYYTELERNLGTERNFSLTCSKVF